MEIGDEGAVETSVGHRMPGTRLSQEDTNSFPVPRPVQLKRGMQTQLLNFPPCWFGDFTHSRLAMTSKTSLLGVDSSSEHQHEDATLADSHSNNTHSGMRTPMSENPFLMGRMV